MTTTTTVGSGKYTYEMHTDWAKLPDEDTFSKTLREMELPPGSYMFPYHGSTEEMKSEEFQQKWKAGPVGTLTVFGDVKCLRLGANRYDENAEFLLSAFHFIRHQRCQNLAKMIGDGANNGLGVRPPAKRAGQRVVTGQRPR